MSNRKHDAIGLIAETKAIPHGVTASVNIKEYRGTTFTLDILRKLLSKGLFQKQ